MMTPKAEGKSRIQRRSVDGVLLLDKPSGCTSNAALQRVKWLYQARKAGHTGSLDPLATGMLPICLGEATKLSPYLLDADKTYEVMLNVGSKTDTGDADGDIIEHSEVRHLEEQQLTAVLPRFLGEITQIPPMYSAIKQGGKRLYELARSGIEVERPPRQVSIRSLALSSYDPEHPVLVVTCSKGTYIRTLVEDIAEAAGTLAHVGALRRLAVAPYDALPMLTLEQLEVLADDGLKALDACLLSPDEALAHWPAIKLSAADAFYLRQGNSLSTPQCDIKPGLVRLGDPSGGFIGIGELLPEGRLVSRRLFAWDSQKNGLEAVALRSGRLE